MTLNNDDAVRKWAEERMAEERAVKLREETLQKQLSEDPTFKLFYDNGMKELIDSDRAILDSDRAIKMAMQATKNKMELEEARKMQQKTEVNQVEKNVSSGPATQSVVNNHESAVDEYSKPFKSLKDMKIENFKNLSATGKLNAQLLKS